MKKTRGGKTNKSLLATTLLLGVHYRKLIPPKTVLTLKSFIYIVRNKVVFDFNWTDKIVIIWNNEKSRRLFKQIFVVKQTIIGESTVRKNVFRFTLYLQVDCLNLKNTNVIDIFARHLEKKKIFHKKVQNNIKR